MRQLIGAPVQLPVGHCLLIKYERNRPWSALCLHFKYLENWLVLRKSCVCGVPSYQQLFLLLFRQQRQVSDVLIGITHNGFEQGLPVSCDALDSGGIKQIRIIHETTDETLRSIIEFQVQIEFRSANSHVHLGQRPSRWQ